MKLVELSPIEARIVGCLIEKQITTPDQYPLSANALLLACNQKSNRDPVMNLDETALRSTLDTLLKKHLVIEKAGFGSRVPKFQHRFCNTEFGTLKFTAQELAIVCELLLRGPQTPGELRSRASRMASFADVAELETTLSALMTRPDGPVVARLALEAGRREVRYVQLFTPRVGPPKADPEPGEIACRASAVQGGDALETRVARLEQEMKTLREELHALRSTCAMQAPPDPADQ